MNNLTRAEFYEKYKDISFQLTSYHKYVFTFEGYDSNNQLIVIECGGNNDAIYDLYLSSNSKYSIHELEPYSGQSFGYTFYDY